MNKLFKFSLFVTGLSLATIGGLVVFGGGLSTIGYFTYGCMMVGGAGLSVSTGWNGVIAIKDYFVEKKAEHDRGKAQSGRNHVKGQDIEDAVLA